ncbi:unnamed protein product, partial [Prunus brigantina]
MNTYGPVREPSPDFVAIDLEFDRADVCHLKVCSITEERVCKFTLLMGKEVWSGLLDIQFCSVQDLRACDLEGSVPEAGDGGLCFVMSHGFWNWKCKAEILKV